MIDNEVVEMGRKRGVDSFEIELDGETLVVVSLPITTGDVLETLTPIERAVALDAVAGLSNAAIAKKRERSVRTIANQLASIYRKLGVGSRAELCALVIKGPR